MSGFTNDPGMDFGPNSTDRKVPVTNDPEPHPSDSLDHHAESYAWRDRQLSDPEFDAEVPADEGTLPPLTEEDKAIQRRMAQEVLDEVADEGTRDNYTPTVSMLIGQELAERLPDSATTDEEFDALQAALVKVFATELQKARAEGWNRGVSDSDNATSEPFPDLSNPFGSVA